MKKTSIFSFLLRKKITKSQASINALPSPSVLINATSLFLFNLLIFRSSIYFKRIEKNHFSLFQEQLYTLFFSQNLSYNFQTKESNLESLSNKNLLFALFLESLF